LASGTGVSVGIGVSKDPDATGTDSTTGNASSTLAGAESSNQVTPLVPGQGILSEREGYVLLSSFHIHV
jgi:hypothetical protein